VYIDFNRYRFKEGPRHMSNKEVVLPSGSKRTDAEGYDEVSVPPPERHTNESTPLIRVDEMPDWVKPAFADVASLNPVQSAVYDTAMTTDQGMLICAPTGAGKTNIALLTILQAF
jgi:pre-mRNA-splicing helicase BRR2